jgi:hypothetical protein
MRRLAAAAMVLYAGAAACTADEAKNTTKDVISGGVEVVGKGISGGVKALASAPEPDAKALARFKEVGGLEALSWERDGTTVKVELGIENHGKGALDASVLAAKDVVLLADSEGFTYPPSLGTTRGVMGATIEVPAGGKVRKVFEFADVPEKAKPAMLRGPLGTVDLPALKPGEAAP